MQQNHVGCNVACCRYVVDQTPPQGGTRVAVASDSLKRPTQPSVLHLLNPIPALQENASALLRISIILVPRFCLALSMERPWRCKLSEPLRHMGSPYGPIAHGLSSSLCASLVLSPSPTSSNRPLHKLRKSSPLLSGLIPQFASQIRLRQPNLSPDE